VGILTALIVIFVIIATPTFAAEKKEVSDDAKTLAAIALVISFGIFSQK
jgi:nitrate reductase gamma subunit